MRQSSPLINIGKPRVETIHVKEPVSAFVKLATEAKFQKLSPGGAINKLVAA